MAWLDDASYMHVALEAAQKAAKMGEIPIGAVIVDGEGKILAVAHNLCETNRTPTAHAEMLALEQACQTRGDWRLSDCTIYVTLEPCPMCTGALIHARIGRIVYGAADARAGACGSLLDLPAYPLEAQPKVSGGVLASESLDFIRTFFKDKREMKNKR